MSRITSVVRNGRAVDIARDGRVVASVFAPDSDTAKLWRSAIAQDFREDRETLLQAWEQRCESHCAPEEYAAGLAYLRDHPEWSGTVSDLARLV